MSIDVPRQAVVFDLDGTLIDSLPLVLAAIRHAIAPFGGMTSMEIFAQLGGPPESFMAKLVGDPAHVPEALHRMQWYHQEYAHTIQLYAGARLLLERVQQRGAKAAVWTGRDRRTTDALLREHGLDVLLATVVCGDDLSSHKPDPAGLREIMRRLGSSAAAMLFVGDADVDVLGGHACGVDTVLIRHERVPEPGIRAKAWRVVVTPAEAYAQVLQGVDLGA